MTSGIREFATDGLFHAAPGVSQGGIFRPVQYLGSKLRSIQFIVREVQNRVTAPAPALDLFSGSSVVAQGLASAGYTVDAVDAQAYAAVFATALLGVDRRDGDDIGPVAAELLPESRMLTPDPAAFHTWLAEEERALSERDADLLLHLGLNVPQVWRRVNATSRIQQTLDALSRIRGREAFETQNLMLTHYAGTYFGIVQAAELDGLRCAIELRREKNQLSTWQHAALLTALLSAASECVFSAGKHFAQPHRVRSDKDLTFLRSRVLQDRAISVPHTFLSRAREIDQCAPRTHNGHGASQTTFESLARHGREQGDYSIIYADPPYTAQQYSRFYHLLDTLLNYTVPELQVVGDSVTRGLYPTGRFKSRFCSKRQATHAMRDLLSFASSQHSLFALSYSSSRNGKTGNDRMITFDELASLCTEFFPPPRTEIATLPHAYRQFNRRGLSVEERDDAEYLFICQRAK